MLQTGILSLYIVQFVDMMKLNNGSDELNRLLHLLLFFCSFCINTTATTTTTCGGGITILIIILVSRV